MQRNFSSSQRQAISQVYANTCAACGTFVAGSLAHADHVVPFSRGGQTTLGNAQLLCKACNLAKSDKPGVHAAFKVDKPALKVALRPWQRECLDAQLSHIQAGSNKFFVAAGVGSGKTVQALSLYLKSDFDMVIAVTPRSGIRGSWQKDAEALGLKLHNVVQPSDFFAGDQRVLPHGYVLNVQMIQSLVNPIQLLCQRFKVLVVVDEAHHLGVSLAWTSNVEHAFSRAAFTLLLSGTPYRGDGARIMSLDYVRNGDKSVGTPDYIRSYEAALAAGEVAPVVTRFVGGSITREHADGRSEKYDYADGDYSIQGSVPDTLRMSTRLRLSAVESFDWQLAAVNAARDFLMEAREDGNAWAGLIACATIHQAQVIAGLIEAKWGDKCMLIIADADTEASVANFSDDTSFTWAISITKISEGVSIDRLRTLVLLSNYTTRGNFEQLRGRIIRLFGGVPQLAQTAMMFVPADPRLIDYAMSSNELMMHSVPWLEPTLTDEQVVAVHEAETAFTTTRLDGTVIEAGRTTADDVARLRDSLKKSKESGFIQVGDYSLYANPALDGAAIGAEFISENEYLALRKEMSEILHPLDAMLSEGTFLGELQSLFKDV
jgi:superfamily II DNA or RNA helicase